jgi:hypothetical protein
MYLLLDALVFYQHQRFLPISFILLQVKLLERIAAFANFWPHFTPPFLYRIWFLIGPIFWNCLILRLASGISPILMIPNEVYIKSRINNNSSFYLVYQQHRQRCHFLASLPLSWENFFTFFRCYTLLGLLLLRSLFPLHLLAKLFSRFFRTHSGDFISFISILPLETSFSIMLRTPSEREGQPHASRLDLSPELQIQMPMNYYASLLGSLMLTFIWRFQN